MLNNNIEVYFAKYLLIFMRHAARMYVSYHFLKLNNIMPFFGMSLDVYDVKVPLLILIHNVMTKIDKSVR